MPRFPSTPKSEYEVLADALRYAVHELPIGILNCECGELLRCDALLRDLERFEKLSHEKGVDNATFVSGCRWHFERYPHYLSRHRHFGTYANYIAKYGGPLQLAGPA